MPLESLSNFVETYAAHGDEIAVRQRRGYRMETWTYGRIAEEANRLARELELRGIAKGDAVSSGAKTLRSGSLHFSAVCFVVL